MYNDLQLQSFGSHYNIEQMLAAKRIIHVHIMGVMSRGFPSGCQHIHGTECIDK